MDHHHPRPRPHHHHHDNHHHHHNHHHHRHRHRHRRRRHHHPPHPRRQDHGTSLEGREPLGEICRFARTSLMRLPRPVSRLCHGKTSQQRIIVAMAQNQRYP